MPTPVESTSRRDYRLRAVPTESVHNKLGVNPKSIAFKRFHHPRSFVLNIYMDRHSYVALPHLNFSLIDVHAHYAQLNYHYSCFTVFRS